MDKTWKYFLLLSVIGAAIAIVIGIWIALRNNWLRNAGLVTTIFYALLIAGVFIGLVKLFKHIKKQ